MLPPPEARRLVFIVDRQQPGVFEALQAHFEAEPDVDVIYDRRVLERRRSLSPVHHERRRRERRAADIEARLRAIGFALVEVSADGGPEGSGAGWYYRGKH